MAEQNKLSEIQGQLNQYGKMARGNPLEDGPFWRLERLMNFGTRIQDDIAGKLPTWDRGSLAKETLEVMDGQIGLSPTLKKAVKDLEQILKNYNKLPEKDQKEVYQDVYKAVEQLKKRYPQALDFQKQVPGIEVPALTDGIKGFHTLQDEIAQKPPGPSVKRPINDHGPLEAPPDVSKWFDRLNEGEGATDHPTLTGKIRTPNLEAPTPTAQIRTPANQEALRASKPLQQPNNIERAKEQLNEILARYAAEKNAAKNGQSPAGIKPCTWPKQQQNQVDRSRFHIYGHS